MLRITEQQENDKTLRLRLDGNVDAKALAELHSLWGNENNGLTVILDMAGVVFMSEEAARQLAKQRNDSLHIINCSPFIEMLLQSVNH